MTIRIVNERLHSLRKGIGLGGRPSLDIPQAKVLENLFNDLLVLYHADYPNFSGNSFW